MNWLVAAAAWLTLRGLILLAFSLVCTLAGWWWVRPCSGEGRGPLAMALGMGTVSTLLLLLALPGWLTMASVVILTVAILGIQRRLLFEWALEAIAVARERPRTYAWVAALALLPLLLASYPPAEFDALTYHLPFARSLGESGVSFLGDLRFPIFPQLQESLFAALLLLVDDTATQLAQLSATAGTAWLLILWGRSSGSPWTGLWSAALWLGNPLVLWIGTTAYVDAGLTFQVTAALYAWERWESTQERAWLLAAAGAAGFAAATKYLGLFFVGVLAVLILRRTRRWQSLVDYGLVVGAVSALWYAPILYYTGNPLFPFYGAWFGFSPWSPELLGSVASEPSLSAAGSGSWLGGIVASIAEGLWFLVLTPWRAVADRGIFGFQAALTPWYWLGIPAVAALWGSSWGRRGSVLLFVYSLFWLTTVRDIRFLLPVLPLLSLLAIRGCERVVARQRWAIPAQWPVTLALLLLAPGLLYAGYKVSERGPIPVDEGEREAFLRRELPGYGAMQWLDRLPGEVPAVYGFRAEALRYYAPGRYLGDHLGPMRYPFAARAARSGDQGLYLYLESVEAQYLLVLNESPVPSIGRIETSTCFDTVYSDASSRLFTRTPTCEIPAASP